MLIEFVTASGVSDTHFIVALKCPILDSSASDAPPAFNAALEPIIEAATTPEPAPIFSHASLASSSVFALVALSIPFASWIPPPIKPPVTSNGAAAPPVIQHNAAQPAIIAAPFMKFSGDENNDVMGETRPLKKLLIFSPNFILPSSAKSPFSSIFVMELLLNVSVLFSVSSFLNTKTLPSALFAVVCVSFVFAFSLTLLFGILK